MVQTTRATPSRHSELTMGSEARCERGASAASDRAPGEGAGQSRALAKEDDEKTCWPIDLIRHPFDCSLSLEGLSIWQSDVQRDNPIASHRKLERRTIDSRRDLFRSAKNRSHACMSHVRFDPGLRSADRLARLILDLEFNSDWTNAGGFRSDFGFDCDLG
jgi:hypothetical protein